MNKRNEDLVAAERALLEKLEPVCKADLLTCAVSPIPRFWGMLRDLQEAYKAYLKARKEVPFRP